MEPQSATLNGPAGTKTKSRAKPQGFEVEAEIELTHARLSLVHLRHDGPDRNDFCRDSIYWIDLCLTPRRPDAVGRFCDHWNPARFVQLGSLIALPPGKRLELRSAGGRHVSLLCQLHAHEVERWLPAEFQWTERRLETSLNIANDTIKSLMLRLNDELKHPCPESFELCDAIIVQLAIELARHLAAASAADTKGGLASWRLRLVDERIADPHAVYPTVAELAALCGLSSRQLSRAFRVSRGCPVNDYLAQYRIDNAKRKLYTTASLTDIAAVLGYSSQSNFTAAFKRATGITPGQFRKRTRAEQG